MRPYETEDIASSSLVGLMDLIQINLDYYGDSYELIHINTFIDGEKMFNYRAIMIFRKINNLVVSQ